MTSHRTDNTDHILIKEAHKTANEINGHIYGEKENGGTNTIYVSPLSFEEPNKGIEKGPGRPHLKDVDNSMEQDENSIGTETRFNGPS